MAVLVLLFVGTFCVIYFASYHELYLKSQEMLERHATEYWKMADNTLNNTMDNATDDMPSRGADDLRGVKGSRDSQDDERRYNLSYFYSVTFDEAGTTAVTSTVSESSDLDSDELIDLATTIVDRGKDSGIYKSWIYHIESEDGITLVVLMDNTITNSNMFTLLRYTLGFGTIMVLLLFAVSAYLSKRIVDPLEESYVKQKQFISDAGHELKTPLAVIDTNMDILERAYGQNKWIDNIKFETERMSNLVCQLLELARAENAKPEMERLDFSRLVFGGVLPFESIAFEKERMLDVDIADDIFVNGNKNQLDQLVSILVDNALDYAPTGSSISIKLKAENGHALFSVANTGKEIPEEDRKNLFERFYRSDSSRTGENPHYGLGLAIAKAVVTSHGGNIRVDCQDGLVIFTASIPTA